MPTYEYVCKDCGEHLEVVQSFKDDALTTCPACAGRLRKVFHSIGISFKGSGFYRTDSRPAAKADGADGADGKRTAEGSGAADGDGAKPADAAASAAKSTDKAAKSTDKAAKSTDSPAKGTDTAKKSTEKAKTAATG